IAGGKLTTYRRMAREVVDRVAQRLCDMGFCDEIPECATETRRLPGAFEGSATAGTEAARLGDTYGLASDVALQLVERHGMQAERVLAAGSTLRLTPDLPYLWAEVDHAIREELVVTVSDVLARRVPLLLYAKDQGLSVCDEVARRLGRARGLDDHELARQLDE